MKSQAPKSFATLLWGVLRLGVHTLLKNNIAVAQPMVERHRALAFLGLPADATAQQIKRRYRMLAKRHHPDCGGDQQRMQRLIAAYELLMRDQSR